MRGDYWDVRRRLRGTIAEIEQLIRDVNYFNDHNRYILAGAAPIDMETERLALHYAKQALEAHEDQREGDFKDAFGKMVSELAR